MIPSIKYISIILAMIATLGSCNDRKDSLQALILLLQEEGESRFYFSHPGQDDPVEMKEKARNVLVKHIENARSEIVAFFYGFNEEKIIGALADAGNRGVNLTLVGTPDKDYGELERAGLSYSRRKRSGLQHSKVFLIDNRYLFSGTGNFTESGFFHNNNAFFLLELPENTARRISEAMLHEENRPEKIALPFRGNMWIAPVQGEEIQRRLVQRILEARGHIRYLIFSHTDPVISAALYLQSTRGVIVEGVYDRKQNRSSSNNISQMSRLAASTVHGGPLIFTDGNRTEFYDGNGILHGGHLHHKTLIVDDHTVLVGSYNWSSNARDTNLEAFYEFHDPGVARRFIEEFERIQSRANLYTVNNSERDTPESIHFEMIKSAYELCLDSPGSHSLDPIHAVVFSGSGLYFRAHSFYVPNNSCIKTNETASSSFGIGAHKQFSIAPGLFQNDRAILVADLRSTEDLKPTLTESIPCAEPFDCPPVTIRKYSFDDGWMILDTNDRVESMTLFDRNGFSEEIPLNFIRDNFYEFEPRNSTGDRLLFFKRNDSYSVGCIIEGATLSGEPEMWLSLYERRTGKKVQCLQN